MTISCLFLVSLNWYMVNTVTEAQNMHNSKIKVDGNSSPKMLNKELHPFTETKKPLLDVLFASNKGIFRREVTNQTSKLRVLYSKCYFYFVYLEVLFIVYCLSYCVELKYVGQRSISQTCHTLNGSYVL